MVLTMPPIRLRRLEPLAWSTSPPMRNSPVLMMMWWIIEKTTAAIPATVKKPSPITM